MDAFIYQAALYCEDCGQSIRDSLDGTDKAPENPDDESSYDSDDYPKGPYPDGGGESDTPSHCDACNAHLENPLTSDGYAYVIEAVAEDVRDACAPRNAGHLGSAPFERPSWTIWRTFYNVRIFVSGPDSDDVKVEV